MLLFCRIDHHDADVDYYIEGGGAN